MKKVTKQQFCPVEVFVAEDGKEFQTEAECRAYEEGRRILTERLSKIECCKELEDVPNCDGGECYESHEYFWYRPKDKSELTTLEEAYKIELGDDDMGKWICIEVYDDGWYSTIEDGISHATHVLETLGYKVKITLPRSEKSTEGERRSAEQFDDFLCQKNDLIDNAAFQLLNALMARDASCSDEAIEWDMRHIAPVIELVKKYAEENLQHEVCHPWFGDDEKSCFESGECSNPRCPFNGRKLG